MTTTKTAKTQAERLAYLMRRHHLDSADVSALLGRSEKTVRQWAAGKAMISDELLDKLRAKLATRPRELDPRTARLFEIMEKNKLSLRDVGKLVGRSEQTVRIWRCEAKIIPLHTLAFLETQVDSAAGVAA
jgi:transcriptional regulator with XRE-family HTH domain